MKKYKVGDKVRIKQREMEKNFYPYIFGDCMAKLAGAICRIKEIRAVAVGSFSNPQSGCINNDYHMYNLEPIDTSDSRDFLWAWHSSMFEPVLEDSELQPSTFLEEGDSLVICEMIGRIKFYNGTTYFGYYLDLDDIAESQSHCACCAKLRELVPNFDKIADEFDPTRHKFGYFPEFSTINDLAKFVQAINNAYNSKKSITQKTLNENEIKFQKPKASYVRGSVPKGNPICGRKHKTAIVIGCLSNQEISC